MPLYLDILALLIIGGLVLAAVYGYISEAEKAIKRLKEYNKKR